MKSYGANKATEFTRKQIGVIYSKAKAGELKVERWMMSKLYDLADYYGYDDNRSVELAEAEILNILEKMFGGKIDEAQAIIDECTNKWFEESGRKAKDSYDRTFVK